MSETATGETIIKRIHVFPGVDESLRKGDVRLPEPYLLGSAEIKTVGAGGNMSRGEAALYFSDDVECGSSAWVKLVEVAPGALEREETSRTVNLFDTIAFADQDDRWTLRNLLLLADVPIDEVSVHRCFTDAEETLTSSYQWDHRRYKLERGKRVAYCQVTASKRNDHPGDKTWRVASRWSSLRVNQEQALESVWQALGDRPPLTFRQIANGGGGYDDCVSGALLSRLPVPSLEEYVRYLRKEHAESLARWWDEIGESYFKSVRQRVESLKSAANAD